MISPIYPCICVIQFNVSYRILFSISSYIHFHFFFNLLCLFVCYSSPYLLFVFCGRIYLCLRWKLTSGLSITHLVCQISFMEQLFSLYFSYQNSCTSSVGILIVVYPTSAPLPDDCLFCPPSAVSLSPPVFLYGWFPLLLLLVLLNILRSIFLYLPEQSSEVCWNLAV